MNHNDHKLYPCYDDLPRTKSKQSPFLFLNSSKDERFGTGRSPGEANPGIEEADSKVALVGMEALQIKIQEVFYA